MGHKIAGGILLYGDIFGENIKGVEMLTLIFVQAFDLNIENRGRIQLYAGFCPDLFGKVGFVGGLYLLYPLEDAAVVPEVSELFECVRIIYEITADKLIEQSCKTRVCLAEPASVRDTVGDIFEFIGHDCIEIVEYAVLENLAVESGNTVDTVAAGNAEVCHTHNSV